MKKWLSLIVLALFFTIPQGVNTQTSGRGHVTAIGQRQWGWSGTGEVFVPQLVMFGGPKNINSNPGKVDSDIQEFLVNHGFNGFHVTVFCTWYNLNTNTCSSSDTTLDPQTFSVLKSFINKVYNAGGMVHLWMWGDDNQHPGSNLANENKKVLDELKKQLGNTPGWSIGYGYDVFEWGTATVDGWYTYGKSIGLPVMMGSRNNKNNLTLIHSTNTMDYWSYEVHKPMYATALTSSSLSYVNQFDTRKNKPVFSEDRFRMRDEGRSKDYNSVETRKGFYHSVMAGGVANIWGNYMGSCSSLEGSDLYPSCPYPSDAKTWIKTYSRFFHDGKRYLRFSDPANPRCNTLTNGWCLKYDNSHFILYKEDTNNITFNSPTANLPVVAVDTKKAYAEVKLGNTVSGIQTFSFGSTSDWVVAIGNYSGSVVTSTPTPSSAMTNTPTPITRPGDANGDGKVDGLDYVIWLNHYNQTISGANNGNFNGDAKVDGLDYVIWLNNYLA